MKKNVISVLLSIMITVGNVGAFPVQAAETSVQEAAVVQEEDIAGESVPSQDDNADQEAAIEENEGAGDSLSNESSSDGKTVQIDTEESAPDIEPAEAEAENQNEQNESVDTAVTAEVAADEEETDDFVIDEEAKKESTQEVIYGNVGSWGDPVNWQLEGDTLTISGQGRMISFGKYGARPWEDRLASIKNIIITGDIENVGSYAFKGTKLDSVTLTDSITNIEAYAFYNCELSQVELPSNLQTIGSYAFGGNNIIELDFPDSLSSIYERAFERNKVQSLNFHNLTYIGAAAFANCSELQDVMFSESSIALDGGLFTGCTSLKNVDLNGQMMLPEGCFYNCSSLETIDLKNIIEIPDNCFYYCTSLQSINMDNVYSVSGGCFIGCTALKEISINAVNNTTTGGTFINSGLEVIHIGKDVDEQSFTSYCLSDCPNLVTCDIATANPYLRSEGDIVFNSDKTKLVWCLPSMKMESYTVPNTVTEIADGAFRNCQNLKNITMTDSISVIGYEAFCGTGITTVHIPVEVEELEFVFENCKDLISVTGGESVTKLRGTFRNCSSLSECLIEGDITIIGQDTFNGCSNLSSYDIPVTLKELGKHAFSGCYGLTRLVFPKSIEKLGDHPFPNWRWLHLYFNRGIAPELYPASFSNVGEIHVPQNAKGYDQLYWPKSSVVYDLDPILLEGMEFENSSYELQIGDEQPLGITVSPFDVTEEYEVQWISSNDSVATVDEDGVVTANGVGDAIITVTTLNGDVSAQCTVHVISGIDIIDQPSDVWAVSGERISFSVVAEGNDLQYQWQWSSNGTTWKNCTSAGYNTDTFGFTMKESLAGRQYRCVITKGGYSIYSEAAEIYLDTFEILSSPEDVVAAEGERITLTVTAVGTDLQYQWQWSNNGTTWKNCTSSGYNTNTFSFVMKANLAGRKYRCAVTKGTKKKYSEASEITLRYAAIVEEPEDVRAAAGEQVQFRVRAEGDDLQYQWQWSSNGTSWKNCTSAGYNTDTFGFTMKDSLADRQYRCVVKSGTMKLYSRAATISLKTVSILENPQSVTAGPGEQVTLKVTAEGEDLQYQWQWSSNGSTWKNCTSAGCNTDTFSFVMKTTLDGRQYRCMVTDGAARAYSEPAVITIAE